MCGIGSDWIKAANEVEMGELQPEAETGRALIIFVKNPVKGKVKTRLAKTMGEDAALEAYLQMLAHVRVTAAQVHVHRAVYYSHAVDETDEWLRPLFSKHVQAPGDLGDKMRLAISEMIALGYQEVVLIGSDLLDLQAQHLEQAFRALRYHDFVVGPSQDGGYYLIGMKAVEPMLFSNKVWSTDGVLSSTLADIQTLGKTVFLLPTLRDIDEEDDWIAAQERMQHRHKSI